MAFPRPTDFEVGDLDHAAEHNRVNEHLNLLHQSDLNRDTLWLRGTGFPTMAAPVGTRYTDTAATNGAIEWIKATGTGTAGWKVVYGDTGRRNLPVADGVLGGPAVAQRVGSVVYITTSAVRSSDATTTARDITAIPSGFKPSTPYYFRTYYDSNAFVSGTALRLNAVLPSTSGGDFLSASYLTNDPWPTALPGTPA